MIKSAIKDLSDSAECAGDDLKNVKFKTLVRDEPDLEAWRDQIQLIEMELAPTGRQHALNILNKAIKYKKIVDAIKLQDVEEFRRTWSCSAEELDLWRWATDCMHPNEHKAAGKTGKEKSVAKRIWDNMEQIRNVYKGWEVVRDLFTQDGNPKKQNWKAYPDHKLKYTPTLLEKLRDLCDANLVSVQVKLLPLDKMERYLVDDKHVEDSGDWKRASNRRGCKAGVDTTKCTAEQSSWSEEFKAAFAKVAKDNHATYGSGGQQSNVRVLDIM